MGVGVSAHRLAGAVAAQGAVGTISAVDLRRHHPDLMAHGATLEPGPAKKAAIDAANRLALQREIAAAREQAQGRGLLAVNVMRAVGEYSAYVRTALEAGIDAVVVGAGLPLDLPDLARAHPEALLVPILSDARGVPLLVKKNAGSGCPMRSSSNTRATPAATSAPPASKTCTTRVSTLSA
jgi:nitronate monooxygenase